MSSVINRATPLMNGTSSPVSISGVGGDRGNSIPLRDQVAGVLGSRHLRDSTVATSSPLQVFVRAKKKINDIYQEIEEYVVEASLFVESKLINKKRWQRTASFLYAERRGE